MDILVDKEQMKQCDKNTIEHFGVPSLVLMERAALAVMEEIEKNFQQYTSTNDSQNNRIMAGKQVLVVCGFGNNGGDGFAVGRLLWQKGAVVTFVIPPESSGMSKETKTQKDIVDKYQIPIVNEIPEQDFDVVVDALFGIGLTRDLKGIYQDYILKMNGMSGLKVAVDIPSGIQADTGAVMGKAFQADLTVTFAFVKLGLLLFPGAEYAGEVIVRDIGIDSHSFLPEQPVYFRFTTEDLKKIPARRVRSNKGSYGKVLVVAGKKNMAGAAFLSGKAAYLTGAGLVKVLTAEENRVILQQLLPEAILGTFQEPDIVKMLKEALDWASVVAAGPGIGTGKNAESLVKCILKHAKVPVVLDADGLNIVSEHLEWLRECKVPVIVTPHLGEMGRLTHQKVDTIKKRLLQTAKEFATKYQVVCVLKDARTVTALPDGRAWINTSGNNGMATAGSGDVLTGIIAGLLAQGMEPGAAAAMGASLHGLAGDRQAKKQGVYGLMAQDILSGIPQVLKEI